MEISTSCSKCAAILIETDIFCNNCGYPENGTVEDKGKYSYKIKLKKKVVEEAENKVQNVKIMLYVLAGLYFLFGIYMLAGDFTFVDGIASMMASVVFIGCVIWVNKQPLTGVLAAFGFWIILQVLAVIIEPTSIFSGLILKIVVIAVFIKGINSAQDAKKYAEQLKEMQVH